VDRVVCFILGISVGIAWYKFYIIHIIDRITNTACDYCSFAVKRKEIFSGRKGIKRKKK